MSEETKEKAVTEQALGNPVGDNAQKPVEPEKGSKEFNFRALERKAQDAEKRALEMEQQFQNLKSSLVNAINPAPQQEESLNLADEDLVEWRHVKKGARDIAREEFHKLKDEWERQSLPERAKARFSDFEQVVTEESIKKLQQEHPDMAQMLSKAPDPFSATYKVLKQFYGKQKLEKEQEEELEKINSNSDKPTLINSSSSVALKNAASFAKKSKDQLYKEMMQYASRA